MKSLGCEKRTRYLADLWGQAPTSTPSSAEPCGEGSIEIEDAEEAEEAEEDAPTTKVDPTFVAKVDSGAAVNALEEWTGAPLTEGNIAEFNAALKKEYRDPTDALGNMDPTDRAKALRFAQGAKEGFDARSYLGNCFRKWLANNPEEAKKVPKGYAELAAYRREWAKTEYNACLAKKTHSREWSRTDISRGVYMSMGQLVAHLGGFSDADAVRGAATLAGKALLMGGVWTKIHPQTELLQLLFLETEFVERFQESWSLYREESLQATLKDHSATAKSSGQKALTAPASTPPPKLMDGWEAKQAEAGEDTAPPSPPKEGDEERPSAEGKPKGTPKRRAGPKAEGEATAAKSHAALLRQAVKAKNKIQAATAKYMETESQINSDVAWEWARSSTRRAEAQALSERLRSSASTFARAFMLEDKVAALLKRTPPAEVESELPKLIAAGAVAVELERVLSQLHRAHVQMHS